MKKQILVVGAGFSGAVIARELALTEKFNILVVDERFHLGGNCHTERDPETGVMVHRYGPHIFNTNRLDVWQYVQQFSSFSPYINRVKAVTDRGVFSLPINLLTINQFFGKAFSPVEARAFISSQGDSSISTPQNFEEQALKFLGKDLYETFFKGYTLKQWGCHPQHLPASILQRLPVRFNYDDNYYNMPYQGIPIDGYTRIVERILDLPNITVQLNARYDKSWNDAFDYIFYTGSLDAYYDYQLGRLGYRTIHFDQQVHEGDYQGNAVINYCSSEIPYTRTHEHKHFTPWEDHEKSVVLTEFSKETEPDDIPYYPKRLAPDKQLLSRYRHLAEEETKVSFAGRLATYRYMDMHHVIGEALDFSHQFLSTADNAWHQFNRFPNQEEFVPAPAVRTLLPTTAHQAA
jgi:UDP-galactopyranose mutase